MMGRGWIVAVLLLGIGITAGDDPSKGKTRSNESFDASLRSRDPGWGVRYLEMVASSAAPHGLVLVEAIPMPANNQSVVFRKEGS